jgi:hypothetical protein
MKDGPAFPSTETFKGRFNPGLTIRDYFAAKAMQGLIATSDSRPGELGHEDWISRSAYAIADEMMKTREEK